MEGSNALRGRVRALARPALCFLLIPAVVVTVLGMPRPLVNLDYLILAAIYAWLPAFLFFAVFLGVLAADAVRIAAHLFYFQPGAFITAFPYLPELNQGFVLAIATIIVAAAVTLAYWTRRYLGEPAERGWIGAAFVGLIVATSGFDAANTGNALFRREAALIRVNVATSSALTTGRSLLADLESRSSAFHAVDAAAATDALSVRLRQASLPRHVVLVLSESWGATRDAATNDLVAAPLEEPALKARYDIRRGVVEFHGSTVPGELRELCGLRVDIVSPRAEHLATRNCLPERMRALGYETISVHGFSGAFFDRRAWYPAVGFDRRYFSRELEAEAPTLRKCGSVFRGQCDADVFDWVTRLLDPGRQQFVYWLSLTAHIPVIANDRAPFPCGASRVTARFAAVCDLLGLNRDVLDAIGRWAVAPATLDTLIIVVGDHAPPFLNENAKAEFDQQVVPYAVLWPRDGAGP